MNSNARYLLLLVALYTSGAAIGDETVTGRVCNSDGNPVSNAYVYWSDWNPRHGNRNEIRFELSAQGSHSKKIRLKVPQQTDIVFETVPGEPKLPFLEYGSRPPYSATLSSVHRLRAWGPSKYLVVCPTVPDLRFEIVYDQPAVFSRTDAKGEFSLAIPDNVPRYLVGYEPSTGVVVVETGKLKDSSQLVLSFPPYATVSGCVSIEEANRKLESTRNHMAEESKESVGSKN